VPLAAPAAYRAEPLPDGRVRLVDSAGQSFGIFASPCLVPATLAFLAR
jgi:hypothetical protein